MNLALYTKMNKSPLNLFQDVMTEAGLRLPTEVIPDGKLHRFITEGDSGPNSWYVFYDGDVPAGAFGCWKRDISQKWCSKNMHELDCYDKERYKSQMQAARDEQDKDRKRLHLECCVSCTEQWQISSNASNDHPYLISKGVNSYGLKLKGKGAEALMVPLFDITGAIRGMQLIKADGSKRFERGSDKAGNFYPVGNIYIDTRMLLICEGYATAASLHQATGYPVVVAFDAGNLEPVSKTLRRKYPNSIIVICADNDVWGNKNIGVDKATVAARSVSGKLAIPVFSTDTGKPTDFNDLHRIDGIGAVKQQIESAINDSAALTKVELGTQVLPLRPSEQEFLPLIRAMQPSEPFPDDALPSIIRNAAQRVKDVIQAPYALICQSFLAAATLAVQAHADIEIDGRRYPLSQNFIAIAESGERKSAVDRIATGPIKDRQRNDAIEHHRSQNEYLAAHTAWENMRKAALAEKNSEVVQALLSRAGLEPQHIQPFYLIEEPTFEGIVRAFAEGRYTLGLFSDEGGRFLGGHAMSKDNLAKTVTGLSKLWDGDPIDRVRGGDGLNIIYNRRLSLHLMIQPVLSPNVFGNRLISGQGFASRCLCCYPNTEIGNRKYKADDLSKDANIILYNDRMNEILGRALLLHAEPMMGLQPTILQMTDEAKQEWICFANDVETRQQAEGNLHQIKGFASKAAEHAARISGVLAVFQDPDTREVGIDAIRSGISIISFYLVEALRLFHSSADDPDLLIAQKVYDWGLQQGGAIALADLYRLGPNPVRDKKTSIRMLSILMDHHQAMKIEGGATVNGKYRRDVWQLRK
jgi:putative DNA primase/helicase